MNGRRTRRGMATSITGSTTSIIPQNQNTNTPITGLNSLWNNHIQNTMLQKNLSWKDAMKEASKTFDVIKKEFIFKADVSNIYIKYIESVKTNITLTYNAQLPLIIAFLKDLRCELEDEELKTKEKCSNILKNLERNIKKQESDLDINGTVFKEIVRRKKKEIELRKDLTALWFKYIKNERYTFYTVTHRWRQPKKMVYNVNFTLEPHLTYGEILDEIIWVLDYEWRKINATRTIWMIFTYWIWYIVFCWKPQIMCLPVSLKNITGWRVALLMPVGGVALVCQYINKKCRKLANKIVGKTRW